MLAIRNVADYNLAYGGVVGRNVFSICYFSSRENRGVGGQYVLKYGMRVIRAAINSNSLGSPLSQNNMTFSQLAGDRSFCPPMARCICPTRH